MVDSRTSAFTTASTLSPTLIPEAPGVPHFSRALRAKSGLHTPPIRPHSLYRRITSSNVGYESIVIVRIKPSPVANLPARLGIKRRVIKDDLTGFSSLKFLRPLPVMNDGQHFAAVRASLPITFKYRFRKLLVRRIRSLFRRAFPGSARKSLLLLHCTIEANAVKSDPLISRRILHEVERHAKCVVKFECILSRKLLRRTLEECFQSFQSHFHRVCEPCLL